MCGNKFRLLYDLFNYRVRIKSELLIRIIIYSSIGIFSFSLCAKNVVVFYPSTIPVLEIKKRLKKDPVFKKFNISVFRKYRDFNAAVRNINPEILIASSEYIDYVRGYRKKIQFLLKGKRSFKYDIVSVKEEWTLDRMQAGSIGLVQFLDRREIKKQVKYLTGRSFKKVARVTKIEDLLNLLALGNADYLLLAPHEYTLVKDKFTMKLNYLMKTKDVFYPVIGVREGGDNIEFSKINRDTVKVMGFDDIESL